MHGTFSTRIRKVVGWSESVSDGARLRAQAARVVAAVRGGRSLRELLPAAQSKLEPSQRASLAAFCYGTLRGYQRYTAVLDRLLDKPLDEKQRELEALLLVGLFQLVDSNVAPYAAVKETVEATRQIGAGRASGLVNAVLRRFQRESEVLLTEVSDDPVARYAHPAWLIERLQNDWPDNWQTILAANNEQAPLWLRVNASRTSTTDYRARLSADGIAATESSVLSGALRLEQALDVHELPGFADGLVSVQDAGAQLAAALLDAQGGQRVLDACSAPGGKTAHILEGSGNAELVALDIDAQRLERVRENLDRLGLEAQLLCADAADIDGWWDRQPFDRVLLDVPCTATGVIRRHPDIKLLRRDSDIGPLVERQRDLLSALWRVLKPGGILLYASCSVLDEENSGVLDGFIRTRTDAKVSNNTGEACPWGVVCPIGRQILPGQDGMDGSYYTSLEKG